MALYHFKIGFPKGLISKARLGVIEPKYSRHAQLAALDDRYGNIDLPERINTNKEKVIEAEVIGAKITKIVYRMRYTDFLDLIVVLTSQGIVKTVWLNETKDKHSNLSYKSYMKYSKPPKDLLIQLGS